MRSSPSDLKKGSISKIDMLVWKRLLIIIICLFLGLDITFADFDPENDWLNKLTSSNNRTWKGNLYFITVTIIIPVTFFVIGVNNRPW